MLVKTRVDKRGRVVIPTAIRKYLGIESGDEIFFVREGDKVIIKKGGDPFKILRKTLKNIEFSRKLREEAEEEALKTVKGDWS